MKNCKQCGNENVLQNGLCGICVGIEAKEQKRITTDINNADHPSRKKAIRIMEYMDGFLGDKGIFDCKDGDTTWYEIEDKLTNIINDK